MAKTTQITVPDIGDADAVEVVEVLVRAGDQVDAEASLITLESDKASMEVPSPIAGKVVAVAVKVGDSVSEGDLVLELEATVAEADPAPEPEPDAEVAAAEPSAPSEPGSPGAPVDASAPADEEEPEPTTPGARSRPAPISRRGAPSPEVLRASRQAARETARSAAQLPYASPSVRKLARELEVDLATVKGTGRKGRILADDVENAAAPAASGLGALPPMPEIDFSEFGEIESEPLTRINVLTGQTVHRSWLNVPHVTHFDEADITELEAFRKASKPKAEERGFKLTFLSFLLAGAAAALREFPRFNASLAPDGEAVILKRYINIGVAVDTPRGLVVPVIHDADRLGVLELAAELGKISTRARESKLKPADFQGGSFTISSLGGIGGTGFTPIINAPEVAILGVSRARIQPVWNGEGFDPRFILPLALSYDHRVIDGADAARFTTHLAWLLSDVRRLLL